MYLLLYGPKVYIDRMKELVDYPLATRLTWQFINQVSKKNIMIVSGCGFRLFLEVNLYSFSS